MAVSLALRNSPRVGAGMRQRIVELAAKMEYRINPYARTLKAQASKSSPARMPLALLNLWNPPQLWRQSLWGRQVTEGCVRRAEELGYYIDEVEIRSPGMTAKRISHILLSRGIRGVLVAPSPFSHSHLSLEWKHFSAAAIGYTFRRPNLHRVTINMNLSMQITIHHLKHARYRRMGLLLSRDFVRRMDGGPEGAFLQYQAGIPAKDRVPILWCGYNDYSARLQTWLSRWRPDVVLTLWPSVFSHLKEAGYSIPRDIGFVLLGSLETIRDKFGVQATRIDEGNSAVGARTVDVVVSQLEHNEFGVPKEPTITLVTPHWIAGETIRDSRGKPL